ncbi:multicopper oxidase domain-containing protein [Streptomyces sp. CC208A]|uniref:multicopper oxidase domain-containing protein n=1 Tax=Streptomyces sp. CC208A TaxID=3044573 RepID=UPI0032C00800
MIPPPGPVPADAPVVPSSVPALAAVGTGPLTACSGGGMAPPADRATSDGKKAGAAEALRRPGPERKARLTEAETPLDPGGGHTVRSWAYGDDLPGRETRVTVDDTLVLTLAGHLPEPASVHRHGIALPDDMDGVPGLTRRDTRLGGSFDHRFAVAHPGTYWFHRDTVATGRSRFLPHRLDGLAEEPGPGAPRPSRTPGSERPWCPLRRAGGGRVPESARHLRTRR